jgi:hypothetical protein
MTPTHVQATHNPTGLTVLLPLRPGESRGAAVQRAVSLLTIRVWSPLRSLPAATRRGDVTVRLERR